MIIIGNPLLRTIRLSVGWGLVFGLAFTRDLYNNRGYLKQTDIFRPDLDRDALSIKYFSYISPMRFCDYA